MHPLAPQAMKKGAQKAPFLNDSSLVGHDGLEPSTNGLRNQDVGSASCDSGHLDGPDHTVRDPGPYSGPFESASEASLRSVVAELAERVREAAIAGDLGLARVLVRGLVGVLADEAPTTDD